jgi:hypothetical protein
MLNYLNFDVKTYQIVIGIVNMLSRTTHSIENYDCVQL